MARKKWVPETAITPALLRSREKRKWQIALRRYVIERKPSVPYAPYFGLDIEHCRQWFEIQFTNGIGWEGFGKNWQFDHIVPVNSFDFSLEADLKMCWNFVNIRVKSLQQENESASWLDIVAARSYFQTLYNTAQYKPCQDLLRKIDSLEQNETASPDQQAGFILAHQPYLVAIENYSSFEFELLNNGRTIDQVMKETAFLKKF